MKGCRFFRKAIRVCKDILTRNNTEKKDRAERYIPIDDLSLLRGSEESSGSESFFKVLINSLDHMLTTRLVTEYGEYFMMDIGIRLTQRNRQLLVREITNLQHLTGESKNWQRPDLDWDDITTKLDEENLSRKRHAYQKKHGTLPTHPAPTPYLDAIQHIANHTGITRQQIVHEIHYHANYNKSKWTETEIMIHRCDWNALAKRIVKDKILVETYYKILVQTYCKQEGDVDVEFLLSAIRYLQERWFRGVQVERGKVFFLLKTEAMERSRVRRERRGREVDEGCIVG